MKETLDDSMMLELSNFIATNLALSYPKDKWKELLRKMDKAAAEFKYENTERFIKYITTSPLSREKAELLASILTINETYFWREPQTFEALEKKIIPALVKSKAKNGKRIRIWSAGCSSGEEAYSIAIALNRVIPDIENWNISILATDIHPEILKKANKGVYKQWSFRNVPDWLKPKYFIQRDEHSYEIIPAIKKLVHFEYQNLAEDAFPSPLNNTNAMDIIFCRNVLMYFTPQLFEQIVTGFHHSLVDDGYLIVSASELSYQHFSQFRAVNFSGTSLYLKGDLNSRYINNDENIIRQDQPVFEHFQFEEKPTEDSPFTIPEEKKPESKPQFEPPPIIKLTRFEEAEKLYKKGHYSEVIEKLSEENLEKKETLLLVRSYANTGDLKSALALCERALNEDSLDSQLYFLYATILQENLKEKEALDSLKKAIYLDHNFALPYYTMGNIYIRQGNLSGAKKCYRNVLSIIEKYQQNDIVPESDGLTVGRFREIVQATIQSRGL